MMNLIGLTKGGSLPIISYSEVPLLYSLKKSNIAAGEKPYSCTPCLADKPADSESLS